MGEKKARSAEELLEEIFSYMNRLVNERRFSKTILLITDLGRTLTNSDRASFWYWDKKKKRYNGQSIRSFSELSIGDYVVHESHGLGIYRGIEKIEVDKVIKEEAKENSK